jgi:hypothetical protein
MVSCSLTKEVKEADILSEIANNTKWKPKPIIELISMLDVSWKKSKNNPNAGSVKIKANDVLTQIEVVINSGVMFLYLLEKVSLVLDVCDSKFVSY